MEVIGRPLGDDRFLARIERRTGASSSQPSAGPSHLRQTTNEVS
ncbi:hypothetical protein ACQ5SK_42445 [Bradyrhizobium japonicum]